jgi:nucleoside 2-deoxyribosyltransferase
MKIYLASSWRNPHYPQVLRQLRDQGHEVYDFRDTGFLWRDISSDFLDKPNTQWPMMMAGSDVARQHFQKDFAALDSCDKCVLLLPCGRSAHLEAGYAMGQGKPVDIILGPEKIEPELMYLMADQIYTATDLETEDA